MSKGISLSVQNSIDDMNSKIQEAIVFLKKEALDSRMIHAVNLVLEEVIVNIIQYGFDDDKEHEIALDLEIENGKLLLNLKDDGKPFNPLTIPHLYPKKTPLEKLESGLGIHIVRNIMNSMSYHREEPYNLLKIWINIAA